MIIDFEKTEEKVVESFKGGNGTLIMRAADDGKVKIMRNTLTAGSSIGMHVFAHFTMRRGKAPAESKKSPELEFVRAILVQFCSSEGAFFFSSSARSMRFSACRASSLSFSGASCFLSSRATMP